MSVDELFNARKSLRAAMTSYRKALIGASPELRLRLLLILEQLENIDCGQTSAALYAARQRAA
jgi:hypothetical protein